MQNGRIAIPSMEKGGLEGKRSGHFGHCDAFTLVDVENGVVKSVTVIPNQGHVQGGCMLPVAILSANNVKALIVGGIGLRPLLGFRQAGIEVYHDAVQPEIRPLVEALIAGNLPMITENQVCGGSQGGSCHAG